MKSHLTSFGLPGIDKVPYGIHMCHFYDSRQELIDGLVPYFLTGLVSNERCIWVASAPLPASEIWIEVVRSRVLERGAASGQLTIVDANEWYGEPASLNPEKIIQSWINEEECAVSEGFQGLRIAGNTSFVPREHWSALMEYEEKLHSQLKERRIVACCSYDRGKCQPVDVLEAVQRHDGVLERADEHSWQVFHQQPKFDL